MFRKRDDLCMYVCMPYFYFVGWSGFPLSQMSSVCVMEFCSHYPSVTFSRGLTVSSYFCICYKTLGLNLVFSSCADFVRFAGSIPDYRVNVNA